MNASRSTNGGTTFTEYGTGLIHTDVHAITIAPGSTSTIFNGNDGGIWKSTDSGVTWTSMNNAPLNTIQFESLALHPTDRNFTIGGTQDNGTTYQNSGGVWSRLASGDGGFSAIDQNAADTTNVSMYHTFFNQTNNLIGYEVSTMTGSGVWTFRGCSGGTSQNGINCGDNVLFYAPMVRGPGNPNTIYFGTDRLYRSMDKGANHTIVSQAPFKSGVRVSAIGISPATDNVRIVGLEDGTVFATTTGANPLTQVETGNGGTIPDKYIARAAIDPNNSNTAYVTLAGFGITMHVWKTTNLNASPPTWTNASGSGGTAIPDIPVNAFVIDPTNSNNLFAGTDIGVYNSTDGGANWNPFGTGFAARGGVRHGDSKPESGFTCCHAWARDVGNFHRRWAKLANNQHRNATGRPNFRRAADHIVGSFCQSLYGHNRRVISVVVLHQRCWRHEHDYGYYAASRSRRRAD